MDDIKIISIGSDHAGYRYKDLIKKYLESKKYTVVDMGTDSEESADYPIFISKVALSVARGDSHAGIVLGKSGNGEAIAANKVKGIRCALCWNVESAHLAKEHNNANMISLGQGFLEEEQALEIVDKWLNSKFEGGRHQRRIDQIKQIEEGNWDFKQ